MILSGNKISKIGNIEKVQTPKGKGQTIQIWHGLLMGTQEVNYKHLNTMRGPRGTQVYPPPP